MKKGVIALIVLGLVVFGAVVFMGLSGKDTTVTDDVVVEEASSTEGVDEAMEETVADESEGAVEVKTFTAADITPHNSAEDCWLSIDGKVYDVTEYIAAGMHPGGEAILNGCGLEDASALFAGIKDGEGHPDMAREYLQNFYIGDVAAQ